MSGGETVFRILDAAGDLVAEHVRIDGPDGGKRFFWRRNGAPGLDGLRVEDVPLYGSDLVAEQFDPDAPIILCEGEKTADALLAYGYKAVATACGASATPSPASLGVLRRRHVVLWPDLDEPGREHMDRIAKVLRPVVASLRRLNWGAEKGDDAFDFFARGGTAEKLDLLLAQAREVERESKKQRLVVVGADKFAVRGFPPRELILSPFIEAKTIGLIYAPRGTGKTIVGVGISLAVVSAGEFLLWRAPKGRRVLYIDGELPRETLQKRIRDVARTANLPILPGLRLLTPDMQPEGVRLPDLATPEGRVEIDAVIEEEDSDLIILDNLSTLVRGGVENEAEAWQPMQDWLIVHRSRGRSILMLHHTGKGGDQRGTSKREDVLDYSIALKRPYGYTPEHGACFEVHFPKARDLFGEGVAPFEARMTDVWAILDLSEKARQERADKKRSMRVEDLQSQIEALLRTKVELSQTAIENAIEGRRDDIRAALRGLEAQGVAVYKIGPRNAFIWRLKSLNPPRPDEAKS